jgi:hypothetical protein
MLLKELAPTLVLYGINCENGHGESRLLTYACTALGIGCAKA